MSRGKNQSNGPGDLAQQLGDELSASNTLHVFAPADSGSPARRVGVQALETIGGEVVAGFAGQTAGTERQRCTLYLSPEINRQLDLAAHIERKERSQVVEVILQQYLPKYRVERA